MGYSSLDTLPNLYAQKTGTAIPTLPKTSNVLSGLTLPPSTTTINSGFTSGGKSLTQTVPTSPSVGIKTESPTNNVTPRPNTTPQPVKKSDPAILAQQQSLNAKGANLTLDGIMGPKTQAAIAQYGGSSSTPATQTVPTYGSQVTDASGRTGTAMFDPNTGLPLTNPNSSPTPAPSNTPPAPTYDPSNNGLYGQLVADLANRSTQSGNDYKAAQDEAKRISDQQTALTQEFAQKDKNIQGTAGFLTQASGLEGQLQKQYDIGQGALASQYAGATNRLGAANTQQGLLQQALQQAAGLAAPQLGNIGSQQYYNPVNQSQSGGSAGTAMSSLPPQAQSAIQSYAQQVKSGQMTRADAESRLSAYGITGTNALNEALGSGFNTNASNASAGTTAIGQQVNTYATSTNAALDKLASDFANLPDWQKLGIPGTIGIEQAIGQFFGNDKLSTYKTTLHDARAQLSGVLSTAGGMTPTSAGDTAQTYLPDSMTKDQLVAKIAAAKTLVAQKVSAFQNSGSQNSSVSGGGLYSF